MDDAAARALLRRLFDAAIAAADPAKLRAAPSARRAEGAHDRRRRRQGVGGDGARGRGTLAGDRFPGLVVTRYGHGAPCERIEIVEAAHPVPDAGGERPRAASSNWSGPHRGRSRASR